jgi:acetylornithine/succinyldiaminopimelate/putrescine aminotransferase
VGAYFRERLQSLCDRFERVVEVRGRGLMLGLGLTGGAGDLYKYLLSRGIITNAVGDKTIRLVPPFIIGEEEIDTCVERMAEWASA